MRGYYYWEIITSLNSLSDRTLFFDYSKTRTLCCLQCLVITQSAHFIISTYCISIEIVFDMFFLIYIFRYLMYFIRHFISLRYLIYYILNYISTEIFEILDSSLYIYLDIWGGFRWRRGQMRTCRNSKGRPPENILKGTSEKYFTIFVNASRSTFRVSFTRILKKKKYSK